MEGLTGTGSLQEFLQTLRFFLGLVLIVGGLASSLLFWSLVLDFLALGRRKLVEVDMDGVWVPVPCKKEMVSLAVPLFFLALSFVFFFLSYLLMSSD